VDIKQNRGINEMDTEQKSKAILSKLEELEHYFEIINVDERFTKNIRTLQETQKIISELVDKNEQLQVVNEMYMNFIKFNKGMNCLGFMIALIAFIFGVTAFLSAIR
jgi:hypothetical protein